MSTTPSTPFSDIGPQVEAVAPVLESVRRRMSAQRRRDTSPELALRSVLHARGLRFRVDASVPGLPRRRSDVLFTRAKLAVFVDGCFWHRCPQHSTIPATRTEWWIEKLDKNVRRDRDTDARLRDLGWAVVRVWEHEDVDAAAERVVAAYRVLIDRMDSHSG